MDIFRSRIRRRTLLGTIGGSSALMALCACGLQTAPPAPSAATAPPAAPANPTAKPAAPAAAAAAPTSATTAQPAAAAGPTPVRGGKLILSLQRDAIHLDPSDTTGNGTAFSYGAAFYNALWRPTLTADGMVPEPELAESWDWVNPTTVVFKLRKGVQFHDGSEFDADVAKWNYERVIRPESKYAYKPLYTQWNKSTQVIDKYTFQINLTQPNALYLETFSAPPLYMLSKAYVEKVGDAEVTLKPSGTGPFKFVEWVKDDHLTSVRFENYWSTDAFGVKRPYADELTWKPFADGTAAFNALRVGTTSWISSILPTDAVIAKNDPNLKVSESLGGFQSLEFQVQSGPFSDKRLRQAVGWAIDREAIHKGIYLSGGAVPTTRLPKTHWATQPDEPYYTYDREKAKALLAQAGVPTGFKFDLIFSNTTSIQRLSEALQAQLKDVGIEANLLPVAAATISARQGTATDWHAAIFDPGGRPLAWNPDLPNLGGDFPGSKWRGTYYATPELLQLFAQARTESDRTKAREIYGQANKIMFDDPGSVALHQDLNIRAMRKDLMGFQEGPAATEQFPERLWFSK